MTSCQFELLDEKDTMRWLLASQTLHSSDYSNLAILTRLTTLQEPVGEFDGS